MALLSQDLHNRTTSCDEQLTLMLEAQILLQNAQKLVITNELSLAEHLREWIHLCYYIELNQY